MSSYFSSITSAVTNSAWSFGGLAVSAAATYITQDSPGARFASGIAMTLAGATTLIGQFASDTPKAPAASRARKINILSGTLMTVGSLYNMVTAILGILQQANTPKFDPVLYGPLVEQFRDCSAANSLWKSSRHFKIEHWNASHPAVNTISRVVKLPNTSLDKSLGNLANMLCHLRPQFTRASQAIALQVRAMKVACKAYEEFMVKLSWYPNRCTHEVARECIAAAEWPEGSDLFRCEFNGPDAAWATAEKLYQSYKCNPESNKAFSEHLFQSWAEIFRSNKTARMISDAFCAYHEAIHDDSCTLR